MDTSSSQLKYLVFDVEKEALVDTIPSSAFGTGMVCHVDYGDARKNSI